MPIRSIPLLAVALSLPLRGEEFALESHIPADFHYRYLSIAPEADLQASDSELEAPAQWRVNDREGAGIGLGLRHGSELSTRRLRLTLGNGLDLRSDDDREVSRYRSVDWERNWSESGSEREGGGWNYALHAHPSVQWFLLRPLFLSASAESRFQHRPAIPLDATQWRLTRPPEGSSDSARFLHSRSRNRSGGLAAGLQARVGLGVGRIEKVGSAARVLYLLDRIAEVTGRPVRLSLGEMHDLEARVEARRKRRPFMDRRRASLHDLETVEMFLRVRAADSAGPAASGAAGSLPARALLAMADEWQHTAPQGRESGFEARLQPFLSWTWYENRGRTIWNDHARFLPADSAADPERLIAAGFDPAFSRTSETRNRYFTGERILGVGLEAAWRRPWRRRFQMDADASARASARRMELGESWSTEQDGVPDPSNSARYLAFEHPRVEGGWDLRLSWYPDSRSRVTGGLGGSGARAFDYTGSKAALSAYLGREPFLRSWSLVHRIHAEAEYLPGYQVSFTAGAAADLDWNASTDDHLDRFGRAPPPGALSRRGLDRSFRIWADLVYYLF